MRKTFIVLAGLLLCSFKGGAQTLSEHVTAKEMLSDPSSEEEIFSYYDMKIFHDRQIMAEFLKDLQKQKVNSPMTKEAQKGLSQGVFNEKDAEIFNDVVQNQNITYTVTDELIQKAQEEPFESFKELFMNTGFQKISEQEVSDINKVDKKAVIKLIQAAEGSGPELGARPVSFEYNETQK